VTEEKASLSEASRRLRETVLKEATAFHDQPVYFAESFRQTEHEPFRVIRVAKAVAHVLDRMPIKIRKGEVLVGWHPNCRPDEKRRAEIAEAQAYLRAQKWYVPASEGHMAPDYGTAARLGLAGLREKLLQGKAAVPRTAPDAPFLEPLADNGPTLGETASKEAPFTRAGGERKAFYESSLIALDGLVNFIRRYADLAARMADETDDAAWSAELRETSRICAKVASEPADTFREALQLLWFVWLGVAVVAGMSHHCFGPGRLDQFLHPYYIAEREAGTLDEDLVDELLDQMFIKCNEFSGPTMSAIIMVVGGRKPDGSDATNELSYKMLEVSDRVRMYFPGVDVSWHADMDEEFVRRAVGLLRNGKGQPSFFNSDLIVKGLQRHGVAYEHAVDHLPSTCTESSIAGRCNPWVAWPYVNLPMCLLYAMFDGRHPATGKQERPSTGLPRSYEELHAAFFEQLKHEAENAIAKGIGDQCVASRYRPFPLLSCFIQGCIERGRNISHGGALYNFLQPEAVGVSNVVDGLAAVRTLVEERKRYTLDDFREAIKADFEGHDDLRRAILRECPKHGNDVEWVNEIFGEVAGSWCSYIEGHKNFHGGPMLPGFLGWTVWIRFGEETPATPDGRKAGMPLANCLGSCTGVQLKGFPSLILSTGKLDHSRGLGGITFNIRFGAKTLAEEEGVDRLKGLIEAAFDVGCYQLQVNLSSAEVLRAAQKNPDDYADLFVRIGGYLVPFTLLCRKAQEDVIARTELEM